MIVLVMYMYIGGLYCILWIDACNSVDDIIFALVFVLTLVQVPIWPSDPISLWASHLASGLST